MTKSCPVCHKTFEADNVYQIYCSYTCRKRAKKERQAKREAEAGHRRTNRQRVGDPSTRPSCVVGVKAAEIKSAIGYHGSGNPNATCEKCRHATIYSNSYGKPCEYVHHVCRRHGVQVGLYGTCFDFSPHTETNIKGDPFVL